jgi:hypothetical protein
MCEEEGIDREESAEVEDGSASVNPICPLSRPSTSEFTEEEVIVRDLCRSFVI